MYIYGNYEINKNNKFVKENKDKLNIKIVSPNFDLKYGLTIKQIEEKLRKLIRYSDPNKKKKHYLFGQREFLVGIVLTR